MTDLPTYALASTYHAVGLLALLVAISFTLDSYRRHRAHDKNWSDMFACYRQGWRDWARQIPRDFGVLFGRVEALPDPDHPYGRGYPLQVGIAHTAWAWAGMAFYWSERNTGWSVSMDAVGVVLPFVWSAMYGRGYLMHLKTIWQATPHRWRLFLRVLILYVPCATILRSLVL